MDPGDFVKHFTTEVVTLLRPPHDPVALFSLRSERDTTWGPGFFQGRVMKRLPTEQDVLRQVEQILEWGAAEHHTLHLERRGAGLVVLARDVDTHITAEFAMEPGSPSYDWWHALRHECLTTTRCQYDAFEKLKGKHVSHVRNIYVFNRNY